MSNEQMYVQVDVKDLTDAALDWAVATAENIEVWFALPNESPHAVRLKSDTFKGSAASNYSPTHYWDTAGEFIDKYNLSLKEIPRQGNEPSEYLVSGVSTIYNKDKPLFTMGNTAREAICRWVAINGLGPDMEIPVELNRSGT